MVELNEKELCLEIRERLSWENSVAYIFSEIKEELTNWYQDNLDNLKNTGVADDAIPENMKNCKKFLDTVTGVENDLSRELKVETLKNIMDIWEMESYRYDCNVSIYSDDIIREGIYQTIEENYEFDGRMDY